MNFGLESTGDGLRTGENATKWWILELKGSKTYDPGRSRGSGPTAGDVSGPPSGDSLSPASHLRSEATRPTFPRCCRYSRKPWKKSGNHAAFDKARAKSQATSATIRRLGKSEGMRRSESMAWERMRQRATLTMAAEFHFQSVI